MLALYGARFARRDLLRCVCHLAKSLTKWSEDIDDDLHHLMCDIHGSFDDYMIGYVGDGASNITPNLFPDANLAERDTYSTSGVRLATLRVTRAPHLRAFRKVSRTLGTRLRNGVTG